MLSNKPSVLQLVALLHAHGIEDVVVCPGSRNAPIVHTLIASGLFHAHPLTDERSAGFFALGLALAKGRPAAVCVTSGSALLNVHPAVAEAYYQGVPLVVISADRPAAWIGQQDGQTMPQPNAFGPMARLSVTLPEDDEWYANRLINEALLALDHHGRGPVHINVPLTEPLYEFTVEALPEVRVIHRVTALPSLDPYARPLLLLGQMASYDAPTHDELALFAQRFLIVADNLSNALYPDLVHFDADDLVHRYAPDLVVTMGGALISKTLKQYLRQLRPLEHWHISADGRVADVFQCQTVAVESPAPLTGSAGLIPATASSVRPRVVAGIKPALPVRAEACPPSYELPDNSVLVLANSTAVRLAQHYIIRSRGVTVLCNRGLNGIEGSVSAGVGYASACPERPVFIVVGDLSFFYDQNALWNTRLPHNLHIVLLNSHGGRIFDTLPLPPERASREAISGAQSLSPEAACRQYGLRYMRYTGDESLRRFMAATDNVLIEIEQYERLENH